MRKKWTTEELISFEDEIGDLYLANKLPFLFHLSGGNEKELISIFEKIYQHFGLDKTAEYTIGLGILVPLLGISISTYIIS